MSAQTSKQKEGILLKGIKEEEGVLPCKLLVSLMLAKMNLAYPSSLK